MNQLTLNNKIYEVDSEGFLVDFRQWDNDFAEGMAARLSIRNRLTSEHWSVINFIRDMFLSTGKCPLVYETCLQNGLNRQEIKILFPTGYLRGACLIAGITYKEGYIGQNLLPESAREINLLNVDKTYRVDVRGFLIDPDDWDEYYAAYRAYDMKIPGGRLTDDHMKIIRYLRNSFKQSRNIPTVYKTCEDNDVSLEELERLFPDGYHRGAVKIAGLRLR